MFFGVKRDGDKLDEIESENLLSQHELENNGFIKPGSNHWKLWKWPIVSICVISVVSNVFLVKSVISLNARINSCPSVYSKLEQREYK
jgi:hypothetical protein